MKQVKFLTRYFLTCNFKLLGHNFVSTRPANIINEKVRLDACMLLIHTKANVLI